MSQSVNHAPSSALPSPRLDTAPWRNAKEAEVVAVLGADEVGLDTTEAGVVGVLSDGKEDGVVSREDGVVSKEEGVVRTDVNDGEVSGTDPEAGVDPDADPETDSDPVAVEVRLARADDAAERADEGTVEPDAYKRHS